MTEQMSGHRLRNVDHAVARLRHDRRLREMSQQKVADHVGVTQSAVSEWENRVVGPTANSLIRWADALGYDVALIPRRTQNAPAVEAAAR